MKVKDILDSKGRAVLTVTAETTVERIVQLLSSKKIGFLIVTEHDGTLAGVISERDIVHRYLATGRTAASVTAAEIMTPAGTVVTTLESDNIEHVMKVMTERKVRHLPVVTDGVPAGVISIGDVIKYILEEKNEEIRSLMEYVSR
ncbi:MAG: CBS domain-containing protein [Bacteroidetes bacterium]|nr:CBS domain-containing protein [Bacteroidota bacterium]